MAALSRRQLLFIAGGAIVLGATWVALLGLLSLFAGSDVVETPGVPYAAGVIAALVALLVWCLTMAGTLQHPRSGAFLTAIIVGVVYVAAMGGAVLLLTGDLDRAIPVMVHLVTAWYAVGVAILAGIVAATVSVLVRLPPSDARWPWE